MKRQLQNSSASDQSHNFRQPQHSQSDSHAETSVKERLNKIDSFYCKKTLKEYQNTSKVRWLLAVNRKYLGTSVRTMTDFIALAYKILDYLAENDFVLPGKGQYAPSTHIKTEKGGLQGAIGRFNDNYKKFKNEKDDVDMESIDSFFRTILVLKACVKLTIDSCRTTKWFSFYSCKDLELYSAVTGGEMCKNIVGEKLLGMVYSVAVHTKRSKAYNDSDVTIYTDISEALANMESEL